MLTASSCYYTGAIASRLRRAQGEFIVRAGQREVLKLHITPQEYMDKMVDHTMVKVHAMAYVKQTRQAWSDEDDFPLHKPRMQVQVTIVFIFILTDNTNRTLLVKLGTLWTKIMYSCQVRNQPSIGQECPVTFSFQNPLNVHLTDCFFTFEGNGVQRPRQVPTLNLLFCEFVYFV